MTTQLVNIRQRRRTNSQHFSPQLRSKFKTKSDAWWNELTYYHAEKRRARRNAQYYDVNASIETEIKTLAAVSDYIKIKVDTLVANNCQSVIRDAVINEIKTDVANIQTDVADIKTMLSTDVTTMLSTDVTSSS